MRRRSETVILLFAVLLLCSGAHASDWANSVTSWNNLGDDPYDDPLSVLGKPTTLIQEPGFPPVLPGVFRCSMVYSARKTAPGGSKLVATILANGWITVSTNSRAWNVRAR